MLQNPPTLTPDHNLEPRTPLVTPAKAAGDNIIETTDPRGKTRKTIRKILEPEPEQPTGNQRRVWTDLYLSRYGHLPENHPLQLYIQTLFNRICDDPTIRIRIAEGNMEMNAFATGCRTIVLSKKIIELCDTEEELLFLLHHEYVHIRNGHAERHPPPGESYIDRLLSKIGRERLQEVGEADMESLIDLDRKSINTAGAFSFLSKMEEWEKSKKRGEASYDPAHGSLRQRFIILKGTFKFKDFSHYNAENQTSIPPELKNPDFYRDTYGFPIGTEFAQLEERMALRTARIETMTTHELWVNSLDLWQSLKTIQSRYRGKPKRRENAIRYLKHYIPLYQRMQQRFCEKAEVEWGLDPHIANTITHTLRLILGTPGKNLETVARNLQILAPLLTDDTLRQRLAYEREGLDDYTVQQTLKALKKLIPNDDTYESVKATLLLLTKGQLGTPPHKIDEDHHETAAEAEILEEASPFTAEQEEALADLDHAKNLEKDIFMEKLKRWNRFEATRLTTRGAQHCKTMFRLWRGNHTSKEILDWLIECPTDNPFDTEIFLYVATNALTEIKGATEEEEDDEATESIAPIAPRLDLNEAMACFEHLLHHLSQIRRNDDEMQGEIIGNIISKGMSLFAHTPPRKTFHELETWMESKRDSMPPEWKKSLWEGWVSQENWGEQATLEDYERFSQEPTVARVLYSAFINQAGNRRCVATKDGIQRFLDLEKKLNPHLKDKPKKIEELGKVIYHLLASQATWDFDDPKDQQLLLRIADLVGDPVDKALLAERVWTHILEGWRTHEMPVLEDFLTHGIPEGVIIPLEIMERIIEEFAETESDLTACYEVFRKQLASERQVGEAVIGEALANIAIKNPIRFLTALLDPESDLALRQCLMEGYFFIELSGARTGDVAMRDLGTLWRAFGLTLEEMRKKLYTLMDHQKAALLHVLLVGKKGILYDSEKVTQIVDFLFDRYIDISEGDDTDRTFIAEAKKILTLALREARAEDTHLIFTKLLAPRLLKHHQKSKWQKTEAYQQLHQSVANRYDSDGEREYSEEEVHEALEEAIRGRSKHRRKVHRDHPREKVAHLFAQETPSQKSPKLDAMGLLIEIASAMGSIGVRFLQLMGLYMEVPERYSRAIEKVYSDLQGQSKLTAHDTLKRHLPPEQQTGLCIGRRVGGGAMLTAYEFETDTLKGIIKVVNPNLVTHTERTFTILEHTFTKLAEENPERYSPLMMLLEDIKEWTLADTDLSACTELDAAFREQNIGMTDGTGTITSSVPNVMMAYPKFVIEERAPGQTLQYAPLNPERVEKVIELIRTRFYAQIMAGIAHSDIHPGNFTLDEEGNLWWLDRTLLLQLTEVEKSILMNAAFQSDDSARMSTLAQGILNLPKNGEIPPRIKEEILKDIQAIEASSNEERIRQAMLQLRKPREGHQANVPLNLTLLLKNQLTLEKMADQMRRRAEKC